MTSIQVAKQEADTRKEELVEKKRANRAQEALMKRGQVLNALTGVAGGLISGGASAGGRIASAMINRKVKPVGAVKMGYNDPSWYTKALELSKDVGTLSFFNPLGGNNPDTNGPLKYKSNAIPGVMTLQWCPTVGNTIRGAAAPINVAARNFYSYVRHANSGSRNYECSDMMQYLIAIDQINIIVSELIKVYGLLRYYSRHNYYTPDYIIDAMGYSYKDLVMHQSDFRAYINRVIERISVLALPRDISLFDRHRWFASSIWKDHPGIKGQIYNTSFDWIYKYDWQHAKLTLISKYEFFGNNANATFSQIVNAVEGLLDDLLAKEDIGLISGDIEKAYGESLFLLQPVPEDYMCKPEYTEEVAQQIRNISIGDILDARSFDIVQSSGDTQRLHYYGEGEGFEDPTSTPKVVVLSSMNISGEELIPSSKLDPLHTHTMINFDSDNPSVNDVFVGTRLTFTVSKLTNSQGVSPDWRRYYGYLNAFGSEIITTIAVSSKRPNNTKDVLYLDSTNYLIQGPASSSTAFAPGAVLHLLLQRLILAQFRFHPTIYIGTGYNGPSSVNTYDGDDDTNLFTPISDVANFTYLADYELEKLHDTAIISEFSIPMIGLRNRR